MGKFLDKLNYSGDLKVKLQPTNFAPVDPFNAMANGRKNIKPLFFLFLSLLWLSYFDAEAPP